MYDVDGGFRAVMFDRLRGVQRSVVGEGTHFRIPWLQTPHLFDVRIRPRNIASNTGTKDLQVVTINLRVLSRPDEEHLPDIFSSLGLDYDERVLPSIGNEVLKAVVAQYNAEQPSRSARPCPARCATSSRSATEFHILLEDARSPTSSSARSSPPPSRRSAASRCFARAPPALDGARAPPPPLTLLRPAPQDSERARFPVLRRSRRSRRRSSAPRASRSRRASSRPPCRSRPPSSSSAASKRRRTSQTRSRARARPTPRRRPEHAPRPRRDGRLLGGDAGRGHRAGFLITYLCRTYRAAPAAARGGAPGKSASLRLALAGRRVRSRRSPQG